MLCFLRHLPDAVSADSAGIHFFAVARMDPGLNFHAREWSQRAPARSAAASRDCLAASACLNSGQEEKEIQQKDNMKYLLMILATMALISTASAAPSRPAKAGCCDGGACCKANSACCKAHTPDKK